MNNCYCMFLSRYFTLLLQASHLLGPVFAALQCASPPAAAFGSDPALFDSAFRLGATLVAQYGDAMLSLPLPPSSAAGSGASSQQQHTQQGEAAAQTPAQAAYHATLLSLVQKQQQATPQASQLPSAGPPLLLYTLLRMSLAALDAQHRDILGEAAAFVSCVLGPVASSVTQAVRTAASAAAASGGAGGEGVPVPHRTSGGSLGLGLGAIMAQQQQQQQAQQQQHQQHPGGTAAAAAAAAAGSLRHTSLVALLNAGGLGEALYKRLMLVALRDLPPHAITNRDRSVAEPLWFFHAIFRQQQQQQGALLAFGGSGSGSSNNVSGLLSPQSALSPIGSPLSSTAPGGGGSSAVGWLHALLCDPSLDLVRPQLITPVRLAQLVGGLCVPDLGRSAFTDALRDLAEALRGRDAEGEPGGDYARQQQNGGGGGGGAVNGAGRPGSAVGGGSASDDEDD